MLEGILGKKIGMSRFFDSDGNSVPVTLVSCGSCYVVENLDSKVKIGFWETKEKSLKGPRTGYLKKKNLPPLKYLKEVKWFGKQEEQPKEGEMITSDIFEVGEKIDVQGTSKGKGFTGVVKRWGFKGGPAGHGSRSHRIPGSIGASSYPSRVWPGKKMPGRKGTQKVTVLNLEVVGVDSKENIIAIRGAVPGPGKGLVFIKRSGRSQSKKK
jgi:large subunit ribosomal protein L3